MGYEYKQRREKILDLLKANELTIYHPKNIADMFGCSVSSARNDLHRLSYFHKGILKVHRLKKGTAYTSYSWYSGGDNKRGSLWVMDAGVFYVSKPTEYRYTRRMVWLKVKDR